MILEFSSVVNLRIRMAGIHETVERILAEWQRVRIEIHLHIERLVLEYDADGQQENLHSWNSHDFVGIGGVQDFGNTILLKKSH
ncbi:hypothetical protein [Propionispira arboris]|uniref:hypothetical protein n=2 Tax=Propionispira TaxID=84034 RepID=UPI000381A6BC|nr:hypothetical protein [Propionispira arboris]